MKKLSIVKLAMVLLIASSCAKKEEESPKVTSIGNPDCIAPCKDIVTNFNLATRFRTQLPSAGSGLRLVDQNNFEGLYFKEIEIVAYDYRPGESIQTSGGFGNGHHAEGKNWSHWMIVQSGHPAGRDNVVVPGEKIDFDKLNGDFKFSTTVSEEFAKNVQQFQIDFLEVMLHRPGIIYDNAYYGNAVGRDTPESYDILYKYPQWSGISKTYVNPAFSSYNEHTWGWMGDHWGASGGNATVNVFFARRDWFPKALVIEVEQNGSLPVVITHSSKALTPAQSAMIKSMIDSGTYRRAYSHLIIVPFTGPLSVSFVIPEDATQTKPEAKPSSLASKLPLYKLNEDVKNDTEIDIPNPEPSPSCGPTEMKKCPQTSSRSVPLANVRTNIDFNLADIIDESTDFDSPQTLKFKGDTNGVPFGLKMSFTYILE